MASAVYPLYKQLVLGAGLNLTTLNIKCVLLSSAYTYSAAHDFHNDLTGVVATSGNLASKTVTNGVFDAADVTFTAVTGSQVVAIVVYRDSGTSATSELICYIDGFTAVTPNGGDITVQWDSGANRIFAL